MKKLSNFGFESGKISKYGSNAKLSEYHAAVGLAQLERWQQIIENRQKIWHTYQKYLHIENKIRWQRTPNHYIPASLPLKIPNKNNTLPIFIEHLTSLGIETRRWYYPPLTEHPAFKNSQWLAPDGSDELSVTKTLSQCLLGLPFHSYLEEKQIAYVCSHFQS